jgi:hypothetical protein
MKRIKTSIFILGILLIGFFTMSAFIASDPSNEIIGVWINKDDPNWKIEFKTNGKSYWYYVREDTGVLTYLIHDFSNSLDETAQFCGQTIDKNV